MTTIAHRFSGSVLFSAEADSLRTAVELAVKTSADLRGANLRGADLRGADLRGADLRGAKITADLTLTAVIYIGPVDSWPVLLLATSGGLRVRVGCHFFTLEEAEAYWRDKPHRRRLHYLVSEGWKVLVRMAGWEETPELTA